MRYMMMIKATKDYEEGRPPSPELMAGMAKLTEEMVKAGKLLAADGLQPSAKGTRLSYSGGKRTVIDGPFAETKELIGGYAIFRLESKEEALALANRAMDLHINAGLMDVQMEIRPMYEPTDFPCSPR
jgi:hypothetical protein